MKNKHYNISTWYHSTSGKQGGYNLTDKMSQKQQWKWGGLNLNLNKTTVMSTMEELNTFSEGEYISAVTSYKVLVVLITKWQLHQWIDLEQYKLGKLAMADLISHKALEVSTNTKVKLLWTTGFPAVSYGCTNKQINGRLMIPWQ